VIGGCVVCVASYRIASHRTAPHRITLHRITRIGGAGQDSAKT